MNIDIKTSIIPSTVQVWRLFPGSNYRFLGSFFQNGVGFLDFPGLSLDKGFPDDPNLFAMMVASQRTKENIGHAGSEATAARWQEYRNARRTKTRGRQFQALLNFYSSARSGDYVIVPSTLSDAKVWVGRFLGRSVRPIYFDRYHQHQVPSRKIEWLAELQENKLSRGLSQSLRGQHPFSLIPRSRYLEVFAAANPSFVFGDRHVSTVLNRLDDFLDVDSALLGIVSKLAASACQSIDEGKPEIGQPVLSALVSAPLIDYSCTQESDIHSEGFNRYISAAKTPIVIAAVVAFLIALPSDVQQQEYSRIVKSIAIENSLTPNDDSCAPVVSEATQRILNAIGFDTAKNMCHAAKEAHRRAGLTPSAEVTSP